MRNQEPGWTPHPAQGASSSPVLSAGASWGSCLLAGSGRGGHGQSAGLGWPCVRDEILHISGLEGPRSIPLGAEVGSSPAGEIKTLRQKAQVWGAQSPWCDPPGTSAPHLTVGPWVQMWPRGGYVPVAPSSLKPEPRVPSGHVGHPYLVSSTWVRCSFSEAPDMVGPRPLAPPLGLS